MLDSRIPLPGLHDSTDVERHLLRLREIAPASLGSVPDPARRRARSSGDAYPDGRTTLSNLTIRRGLVLAAGLVLLLLPLFVRAAFWGYHRRPYAPSELPSFSVAATPQPTVTPWAQTPPPSQAKQEPVPAQ